MLLNVLCRMERSLLLLAMGFLSIAHATDDLETLKALYLQRQYDQALPGLFSLADQGNLVAQTTLCEASAFGLGMPLAQVPPPYCYASANKGNDYAKGLIALILVSKNSTPQKISEGLDYARRGYGNGDGWSAYVLAQASLSGIGMPADATNAMLYYTKAAQRGINNAVYQMGFLAFYGVDGVPVNVKKGLEQLKAASDNGSSSASYELGKIYRSGNQGVSVDISAAEHYYTRAARANNSDAQYALFYLYMTTSLKDLPSAKENAINYLKNAAKAGHAIAQYEYARILWNGELVPIDRAIALLWFKTAEKQGYLPARLFLGDIFTSKEFWNPSEGARLYTSLIREHPGTDEANWAGIRMAIHIAYGDVPGTPEEVEYLLHQAESSPSTELVKKAAEVRAFFKNNPPRARASGNELAENLLELMIMSAITSSPDTTEGGDGDDKRERDIIRSNCNIEYSSCTSLCDTSYNSWDSNQYADNQNCNASCETAKKSCTGEW